MVEVFSIAYGVSPLGHEMVGSSLSKRKRNQRNGHQRFVHLVVSSLVWIGPAHRKLMRWATRRELHLRRCEGFKACQMILSCQSFLSRVQSKLLATGFRFL